MGDYDEPAGDGRRPWLVASAVVLALVVGLTVGYLVGGGTSRSSSVSTVEAAPEPSPNPVPAPTPGPPSDPATPQPCLAAGAAATQVLQELEAAVAAIGALDPAALRGILDRLQPLQGELEASVAACRSLLDTSPTG